jgi:hypothetical protein
MTTIQEDDAAAKRAAEIWDKEKESKSGSGTGTWWTDRSQTDDGIVAAAAGVFKRRRLHGIPNITWYRTDGGIRL